MNDRAQRIAIAEAFGAKWGKFHDFENAPYGDSLIGFWKFKKGDSFQEVARPYNAVNSCCNYIPDYCNDLNAMHGAEIKLEDFQKQLYLNFLSSVVGNDGIEGFPLGSDCTEQTLFLWRIHVASPAKRAEAFLKTIGKWKDEPATPPTFPDDGNTFQSGPDIVIPKV